MYYTYTDEKGNKVNNHTNWHADSLYLKNGEPMLDNSQKVGASVAIFIFGNEKNLWFHRHYNQHTFQTNTSVQFKQKSGSMIVLDARDEKPENTGFKWVIKT
eukprot:9174629-Ditylum_brightwellii.AAC.1